MSRTQTALWLGSALLFAITVSSSSAQDVLWRFQIDSEFIPHRPGVAADGTVYVNPVGGGLYAIRPDGTLAWQLSTGGQGGEGPVVVGGDGTVYFSDNPAGDDVHLYAVAADGTVRWIYKTGPTQGLIAGPALGPDGNLYAVTDVGGLGAFSLNPAGKLRWSNIGNPEFIEHGQLGLEIVFHEDRLFLAFDEIGRHSSSVFYGLTLDGTQLFAVDSPGPLDAAQPVVGNDRVYFETWDSSTGIRLGAFDGDGNHLWTKFDSPTNVLSHADVGPDETIYVTHNLDDVFAIAPDGSTRWTLARSEIVESQSVAPHNATLVLAGVETFGEPGFFAGVGTDGDPLWKIHLPREDGGRVVPTSPPAFSPDGSIAYFGTDVLAGSSGYCYLYAVRTGPWATLGHALEGSGGTPLLTGRGTLEANADVSLQIQWAPSSQRGFLIFGFSPIYAPFGGGVMVPLPEFLLRFGTDSEGEAWWQTQWPDSIPSGTEIYTQAWILDPAGVQGWSATNALRAITP